MTAEKVVRKLIEKGYRIAAAESCTGGMVAAEIVSVPDASRVLDASVVTYANAAKVRYAQVTEESLRQYGAVSRQVAEEMAAGIAKETGADVGISTTGIAGPGGGSEEKPVGTVWMGISIHGKTEAFVNVFSGDRNQVRKQATEAVLTALLEKLG